MIAFDFEDFFDEDTGGLCPICKDDVVWGPHLEKAHEVWVTYAIEYTDFTSIADNSILRMESNRRPTTVYTRQRVIR